MKTGFVRLTVTVVAFLTAATFGFAGPLDEYYLQKFGESAGNPVQKAVLLQQQETAETPHCGTPLKHGLQRDWNQLEAATQKTLAKQLAAPVLRGTTSTLSSPSGRFLIHYTTTGADAVPSLAWVQAVAQTFDDVAASYLGLGWHLAPTAAGAPYDVYLSDLAPQRIYGQTIASQQLASAGFANAFGSFIEIDNDYLDPIFQNALDGPLTAVQKALQILQITSAHEYHHAIQFGYNFFFDDWYGEATSSWFEDELYDDVNQLYGYLAASMGNTNLSLDIPADTSTGGGYGRWLLNRHFSESHGGQNIIRSFWESLATKAPSGFNDIPMSPILDAVLQTMGSDLGRDLLGYAGKLYTGTWSTHPTETALIHPVSMLSTSSFFPITVASIPTPSITLPHYSFAFFKLVPATGAPATLTITLTRATGISAVAFRKTNTGITPFSPNPGTNLIVIPDFNTASEVALLVVNATANDNLFAGFSSDGSPIQFALPGAQIQSATPSTAPPSITLTWAEVAGATSYQIYRSTTSSTTLTPYTTTLTTSYTDTYVLIDHTYYYAVIPVNAAGLTGPASKVTFVTVTTPAAAPVTYVGGGGGGGGACFIATAAYGSYLHPQVQILRDFRDTRLLTNAPGRAFVALYYRLSPPAAAVIAQHAALRLLVRFLLTPLVLAVAHPAVAGSLLLAALCGLAGRKRWNRTTHHAHHNQAV